jgi:hypothetical protein
MRRINAQWFSVAEEQRGDWRCDSSITEMGRIFQDIF